MKTYLVSIGYSHVVIDDPEIAIKMLRSIVVEQDYVNGKHIYRPSEGHSVNIKAIDTEDIRNLTKEEVENKELKSAKNMQLWAEQESDRLKEEIKELKRKLLVYEDKNVNEEDPS